MASQTHTYAHTNPHEHVDAQRFNDLYHDLVCDVVFGEEALEWLLVDSYEHVAEVTALANASVINCDELDYPDTPPDAGVWPVAN